MHSNFTIVPARKMRRLIAVALIVGVVSGCATVDPKPDFQQTADHIAGAVGETPVFDPDDEAAAEARVRGLLGDGITTAEATQIALLNNPAIQAGFFRVGMSRADFVQSGLFSNPTLAMAFAFPEGGGRSNIQGTLAQNIVDLWQIPIRKRIAAARLEQEILSLAQQAARLATDVKLAYFDSLAADRTLEIARANQALTVDLLSTTLARKQAGSVTELDVTLARTGALNSELDAQTARLNAANARRRLAVLLGVTDDADNLHLLDSLPDASPAALNSDSVIALARASRLDLRASHSAVAAGRQRVTEEYAKIFPDVSIGTYLERTERRALPGRDIPADTARASIAAGQLTAPAIQSRGQRDAEQRQEIDTIFGPALNLTLPIFDQNQAQIAKARYAYLAALKEYDALDRRIVQDVRRALDQAATAASQARGYRTGLMPQAEKSLDLAQQAYKSGNTTILIVLEAQRGLLGTRRLAVAAQQNAAIALAELELTVGRPWTVISAQPAPSSQPGYDPQINMTALPLPLEEAR